LFAFREWTRFSPVNDFNRPMWVRNSRERRDSLAESRHTCSPVCQLSSIELEDLNYILISLPLLGYYRKKLTPDGPITAAYTPARTVPNVNIVETTKKRAKTTPFSDDAAKRL
jgi:hypothetical protein